MDAALIALLIWRERHSGKVGRQNCKKVEKKLQIRSSETADTGSERSQKSSEHSRRRRSRQQPARQVQVNLARRL